MRKTILLAAVLGAIVFGTVKHCMSDGATAAPEIAINAPAGKCWIYNPTYCSNLTRSTCSGARCQDIECGRAGQACDYLKTTDSTSEPELLPKAKISASNGFLTMTVGSTRATCGHYTTCVLTDGGVDVNGLPILLCTKLDGNGGVWEESTMWLSGDCPPAPPPPTVPPVVPPVEVLASAP